MKISCQSLFLDSGAHSLYNEHGFQKLKDNKRILKPLSTRYDFFTTKAFWKYVDKYAKFVKKHKAGIDHYVSVDVIGNPELSWEVLKYLERKHKLRPLPVLHDRCPTSYMEKHLRAGYKYIGLGGVALGGEYVSYKHWADTMFDLVCDNKQRLPCVKLHGFAMTTWDAMVRWPWYSLDSASWIKSGAFGSLYIPRTTKGEYDFTGRPPWVVSISDGASAIAKGTHYKCYKRTNPKLARKMEDWVDYLGLPYGKTDDCMESVEWGVFSDFTARAIANARYFMLLANALPNWPWPFTYKVLSHRGFGIEC